MRESHELEVYETQTSLCPDVSCGGDIILPNAGSLQTNLAGLFSDISVIYLHLLLPEDFTSKLPVITQTWKDFRENLQDENTKGKRKEHWKVKRPVGFANFVDKISYSESPGFYFIHSLLPHVPWKYLPDGKEYMTQQVYDVPGLDIKTEQWSNNDWLVIQGYQRHLLQVGFVDKLLGDLINRLKEQGLYERSIIIITADHGVSFWPNSSRRGITEQENRRDLLGVPLFIKLPNQEQGVINDYAIRSIDILPTLAQILELELPLEVDGIGAPLFSSNQESKPGAGPPYSDSKSLKLKLELFGSGEQNAKGLYRFGFYRELIGRKISELAVKDDNDVSVTIDQIKDLSAVDFSKSFIPAYITGSILGVSKNIEQLNLALAINGTIAAVTMSYPVKGGHKFSAIIPASSFRDGYNVTDVLAIKEDQGTPFLSRLTASNANRIETGRVYDFADDTQATLFFGSGWSSKSDYGARWNVTNEASLSFLVKNNEFPLELIVQSSPFIVKGKHELQVIEASFLSGTKQFIKLQQGDTDGRFTIHLMPKDIGPGGEVVVELKFLNAISPESLGINTDTRLLAIRVKTIQVLTAKVTPD